MPIGSFVILLLTDQDYKVYYYFKDPSTKFEVTSDIFLRLNLDHEKNDFNYRKIKNDSLISYLHNLKGRISRKASGFIIGIVLSEEENPDKFQEPLKNAAMLIQGVDFLEMDKTQFEKTLKTIFEEKLESVAVKIDANDLKESIINRAKEMLSGGKKQRKLAAELLDKIEMKEHIKIADFYKLASEALAAEEFERAGKLFDRAAVYAEGLLETELANTLKEKASASTKIPISTKGLGKKIQQARDFLRREQFNAAYVAYRKASEMAKELLLPDEEEEFRLKSKALQEFYQVDQKFKKKKK